MNSKIWLSSPHMSGKEDKYIKNAFETNWVAPIGENIDKLESDLNRYLGGNKHVVALSSGTAAIHLALVLSGVTSGDEVLCQSFTFSGSAFPIKYLGAKPIFIDSEKETWNMDPYYLEIAILDRIKKGIKPKALIFVNIYGMPARIDDIITIARKYNISVIEDAAESLGSSYKNKRSGTFGDFSIFSFNGNKIITTSGGGALVCKTLKEKKEAIFYATQAKDSAPHYQHSEIGYNYRLSNILAGIGRGQMEVIDDRVRKRRENHSFYERLINNSLLINLFKEPNKDYFSNHWLNCIIIDDKASFSKDDIIKELDNNNIEARPLWKPMHLQPVFKDSSYYGTKISEDLFNRGVCLPSGSNLTQSNKNRISSVLNEFISL